ncbi:MAG: NAD-glutamate dehydrogenase domain-containing protein, partial [Lysobacterales bacterium]
MSTILDQLSVHPKLAGAAQAQAFAQGFLAGLSDDDLAERDADTWLRLIIDLLAFAGQREPGSAKVRVFNPTAADNGWDGMHTVIQIVNDDMPFLVDSVGMAVHAQSLRTHLLIHPVFNAQRSAGHELQALGAAAGNGLTESVIHLEVDRQVDDADLDSLRATIEQVLTDVRNAVADWQPMLACMAAAASGMDADNTPLAGADLDETRAFLRWLADDNFTFVGYREYEVATVKGEEVLRPVDGTGLGILRKDGAGQTVRSLKTLPADGDAGKGGDGSRDAVIITKTNARSTVHRPGHLDYIGVLRFDDQGNPVRELRFIGLFTSGAYMCRPGDVPLVRTKVSQVMQRSGLSVDSHRGKALKHVLETLPRDELFQCTADDLFQIATGIVSLQERSRTRLFLRPDRYGRFWSALVFIPRDRFNTTVREGIEALLHKAFQAQTMDTQIQVSESSLARLHLVIRPQPDSRVEPDVAALESQVRRVVRNWYDELCEVLVERNGSDTGVGLFGRHSRLLPTGYVEENTPEAAAADIEAMDQLDGGSDLRLNLYQPAVDDDRHFRFKLYRLGEQITLSEALPMMENMGLRIVSEHPYTLEAEGQRISLQDFEITFTDEDIDVDVQASHVFFEEAFEAVWRGEAENDSFNRLIVAARLFWREVALLRAYTKYLLQVGVPFSQAYFEQTINAYPILARLMIEVFQAKFDPERAGESAAQAREAQVVLERALGRMARSDAEREQIPALAKARAKGSAAFEKAVVHAFKAMLEHVGSLDEDRILRSVMAAVHATLRCNFYQQDGDGRPYPYFAFKIDPSRLIEAPRPLPYREVYVYSPRVEGSHLRFGPVARGGLRWSDRREDFRTEVLGLVKAQMVKNTVIVPVGAKGGFIVKRPPVGGDRDAFLAEGVSCYRTFINGLLDVSDNLINGESVTPPNIVRHDDEDYYMVVAADKGTATFSDIANAISEERGFWLGDAFASGGSYGYDHKGMGITARGAWESVKRHFRALGVDSQKQDFTAAGIGDMSGDVFGNGMRLSR